jgi:hypothetical protein
MSTYRDYEPVDEFPNKEGSDLTKFRQFFDQMGVPYITIRENGLKCAEFNNGRVFNKKVAQMLERADISIRMGLYDDRSHFSGSSSHWFDVEGAYLGTGDYNGDNFYLQETKNPHPFLEAVMTNRFEGVLSRGK